MERVAGFPYFEVDFDTKGRVVDPDQVAALTGHAGGGGASDLLVLSHGWNNDKAEARSLYRRLLGSMAEQLPAVPGAAGRDLAVMAVFWPSKKFAERDLIPGGAAGLGGAGEVSEADLRAQLAELEGAFDEEGADEALAEARELVGRLDDSVEARRRFVEVLRGTLLPPEEVETDDETAAEVPSELHELPGDEVLDRLAEPPEEADEPIDFEAGGAAGGVGGIGGIGDPGGAGGAADLDAGGAAGFGEFFGGVKEGARNFLNLLTYYKMKNRAGIVGAGGAHQTLRKIRQAAPGIKLHLVGHSFGGRLVSAAASGPGDAPALPVDSISLLQAAFSHYGFADRWDPPKDSPGFFRRVLGGERLRGPMIVTHTVNDRAVGIAYPLASRLARQVAAALGDENDVYGGLGRNGALATPEARERELLAPGGDYELAARSVFNLKADRFVSNHSDVTGPAVAYAVLCALGAS